MSDAPRVAICCRCDGQYLDIPDGFTEDPLLLTWRLSNPCQCTRPERPVALRARDTTAKTMPIPNVSMEDLVRDGDSAEVELTHLDCEVCHAVTAIEDAWAVLADCGLIVHTCPRPECQDAAKMIGAPTTSENA